MTTIKIPKTKIEYYMDERLEESLRKKVKPLLYEKDEDCVIAIDGNEGCQPKGDKVLMSDGSFKDVSEVKVGDEVISPQLDGSVVFSKVLKTYRWFSKEIYDVVKFDKKHKYYICIYSCSANHLIPVVEDLKIKYIEAINLIEKEFVTLRKDKDISIEVKKTDKKEMVYGFLLDSKSSLYITNDYVVTHNSGKSTLAFQIGKYVDPSLNLNRIVFDAESFKSAVLKAKPKECIIFDEAFSGFSSRASLSGVNRALVSLVMQMRQKNLFVIIVLPTFFLLDKYVALFRTQFLVHVYKNKGIKGYFRVYNRNKKKLLFLGGRQTYSYNVKFGKKKVETRFKGRFYGVFAIGDKSIEERYRAKKEKALMDTEKTPISAGQIKYKDQRDKILFLLRKETKKSYQEIEELLLDLDVDLSYVQVRNICVKFGDSEKLELKKEAFKLKKELEEEKHKLKEINLKSSENKEILNENQ